MDETNSNGFMDGEEDRFEQDVGDAEQEEIGAGSDRQQDNAEQEEIGTGPGAGGD